MKKTILITLLTIFLLLKVGFAIQEDLTVCQTNTECQISDFVYNDSYQPYFTQDCTINITYPNSTMAVTNGVMSNNSIANGYYNYSFFPPIDGYYSCEMFCNFSGDVGRKNCDFIAINLTVYNISEKIGNVYNLTDLEIWVGGNYNPDENTKITATLAREGMMISGEIVNITITYPNGTTTDSETMTDLGGGIYTYDFTPTSTGDYIINVTTGNTTKTGIMTVSTVESYIHSEHMDTQDKIESEAEKTRQSQRDWNSYITSFFTSRIGQYSIIIIIITVIIALILIGRWANNRGTEEEIVEEEQFT